MAAHWEAGAIISVAIYEKKVRNNVAAILRDFEAAGCEEIHWGLTWGSATTVVRSRPSQ
jgi:hypothetical protein